MKRIRKAMVEKDQGFTLIELLVVIIVIGILSAIAIPVFLNQRKKGIDASLKADIKSTATLAETIAVDDPNGKPPTSGTTSYYNAAMASQDNAWVKSPGNTIYIKGAPSVGFCITATNPGSTGYKTGAAYWYDSALGGMQPLSSSVPAGGVCAMSNTPAPSGVGAWLIN